MKSGMASIALLCLLQFHDWQDGSQVWIDATKISTAWSSDGHTQMRVSGEVQIVVEPLGEVLAKIRQQCGAGTIVGDPVGVPKRRPEIW